MEKDNILERWTEYIEELFDDEKGQRLVIMKNIDNKSRSHYSNCTQEEEQGSGSRWNSS